MTIFEAAETLLNFIRDSLTDPPERRYVAWGIPAHDFAGENCADQLTVSISAVAPSQSLPVVFTGKLLQPMIPQADLLVELVRCVPTMDERGRPPSATELQDSAESLATDMNESFYAVLGAAIDGSLFDGACRPVAMTEASVITPEGGVAGFNFTITVEL